MDGYHATAMRDSYDVLCDVGARSVKLINDAANDKNLVVSSMEEFIQRQIGTVRARAAGFVSMRPGGKTSVAGDFASSADGASNLRLREMFGTFTESLLHKVRRTSRGMDKGEARARATGMASRSTFARQRLARTQQQRKIYSTCELIQV